jgi:ABC-type polysaccharide/polyol phosphate transport system ATPase subunit
VNALPALVASRAIGPARILVEDVGKRFWLREPAAATFQQAAGRLLKRLSRGQPFWALREVSVRVGAGEAVCLLGKNGAGKSTLLRLVCGLGRPTTGRVRLEGRVAALLELGAGFHPMLTGRENVYVSAVVSGMRRAEVDRRFPDIAAFADIGQFIDQPFRTYSAGMQMRLAFAVAIHTDPDSLVIDEVLAVGDTSFQERCIGRIERFRRAGKTLLVASHDVDLVTRLCDRGLVLHEGRLLFDGPVGEAVSRYAMI